MHTPKARGRGRRLRLRALVVLGFILALLVAQARLLAFDACHTCPTEDLFLLVDHRVDWQRRRERRSAAALLVDDLLEVVFPVAIGAAFLSSSPALTAVAVGVVLHFWVIPRARCQVLHSMGEFDLDDVRGGLHLLNRLDRWVWVATVVTMVVTTGDAYANTPTAMSMIGLGVRPQTLQPAKLTSPERDGVVDHFRVRTDHTKTHWVVTIRQPITLRIPREDPDQADVLMVQLHCGTDPDTGKPYLDQTTVGLAFGLSRQMTNERIASYKRRERIADVLEHERRNHALTPPVVQAIHRAILDDPLVGASAIRRHLVEIGVVAAEEDIALTTIDRASRTVDYPAVRTRIHEMLRRGEIVPDHQKIAQILLKEMDALAAVAGKKAGQVRVPMAELLALPSKDIDHPAPTIARSMPGIDELPSAADCGASPGLRWTFLLYFTSGASYREIAMFLGVRCGSTIYRRLNSLLERLPPLQAFLGPVRHSDVVAIDEKFILAPRSNRGGKMGRWVYLFLAIDPHSYDLLHAEVYPSRTTDCARAFLIGLKAKGVVSPKVIVSDLWGPYETLIPELFPSAVHHQCVFHAEQATSKLMLDKLGSNYASIPEARALKAAIIDLFRAASRRTLVRRYKKLLTRKPAWIESRPQLKPVFDSLERHFERLANAYTSRVLSVPKTNNAVERVIRCFTRRYKTMAGFNSLETAQRYVRLWEYYYRFRPFTSDASRRIRNRSPLQIAGYEVQGLTCLDLVMPPPQVQSASRA